MNKALLLAFTCAAMSSMAHAHDHSASAAPVSGTSAYAIPNPLRPGAKAPYCEAQAETADGCTFHSVAGAPYTARLTAGPGETWVATASDTTLVAVEPSAPGGQPFQQLKLVPNPADNADATVTFDKLSGDPGTMKVVERRRINVMIHPS